jgi:hypothetical protein
VIKAKKDKMGSDTACMGKMRNAYKIYVGRHRHRWIDIRMDLRELQQDRDQWKAHESSCFIKRY